MTIPEIQTYMNEIYCQNMHMEPWVNTTKVKINGIQLIMAFIGRSPQQIIGFFAYKNEYYRFHFDVTTKEMTDADQLVFVDIYGETFIQYTNTRLFNWAFDVNTTMEDLKTDNNMDAYAFKQLETELRRHLT